MKANSYLLFVIVLAVCLAVFLMNMTFSSQVPGSYLLFIRASLVILFYSVSRYFHHRQHADYSRIAFILMAVNLAFLLVSFVTPARLGLNLATPQGIAFAKLGDSVIISFVLMGVLLLNGLRLEDLFLVKGKFLAGVLLGMAGFAVMAFVALNNPEQQAEAGFWSKNFLWIVVFIFANALMEELLFRGIFLKSLNLLFRPGWSILLTSLVFSAAHMQVTYTPDVLFFVGITFVLALLWGYLMHYTQSMLASVLFHAGADLIIIIPIYITFGAGVK